MNPSRIGRNSTLDQRRTITTEYGVSSPLVPASHPSERLQPSHQNLQPSEQQSSVKKKARERLSYMKWKSFCKDLSDVCCKCKQIKAMLFIVVGLGLYEKTKAWALCLVYIRVWGTWLGCQVFFSVLNNSYTLKVIVTDNLKKKIRCVNVFITLLMDILNIAVKTVMKDS